MLVTLALIAGCGGDDDDNGSTSGNRPATADRPAAKEPLKDAAARLQELLPNRDCEALMGVMVHSIQRGVTDPAKPPSKSDCAYVDQEAREQLKGYRVTKVREFGGTAGFTEGTGAGAHGVDVIGIVWLLDSDGSWKAAFEATFRPQIGPPPHLPKEADANAATLVGALIKGDCETAWRGLHVSSRFVRGVDGRRAKFCSRFPAQYGNRNSAFAQMKAEPSLRPELLGRTRDFSFYALRLSNGRYIDLVTSGPLANVAKGELKEHANPSVLELVTVRQPG